MNMLDGKWCIALELEESEFCAAAQRELGYRIVSMAESVLAVACIPGEDSCDLPSPCFCNWGTKWARRLITHERTRLPLRP